MNRGGVRLILLSSAFLCVSVALPRLMVMHEIKKESYLEAKSNLETNKPKALNIGVVAHQEHNESADRRGIDALLEAGFNVKRLFLLGDNKKISKTSLKEADCKTGVPLKRLAKMQHLATDPDFSKMDLVFYDLPTNFKPPKEPLLAFMSQLRDKK